MKRFTYPLDMKIGYARVSTLQQNLSLQEDSLNTAGCSKIFTDKVSSSKSQRPGLDEALSYVRKGDVIVVWRLDRLARSLNDLVKLVTFLEEKGVHIEAIDGSINTTTLNGKLVFHIFAALAQFEKGLIQECTRAGLQAARARGRVGGRPHKLNPSEIKRLQVLMQDRSIQIQDLEKMFGVSRTTLYRYARMSEIKADESSH